MRPCPSVLSALEKLAARPKDTPPSLRVIFPDGTAISHHGVKLSSVPTKATPALSIARALLKPQSSSQDAGVGGGIAKYIAVCLDLDAPFPSFSFMGPIAHWIQADLIAVHEGVTANDDSEGFTTLEPESLPVMPYVGPGPPPPSAPHRYVFLLWEQPPNIGSSEAVREILSLSAEPGLMARIRWDQSVFETKMGLGEPLAANYFVATSV
ncbi:hypothetical protein NQ176_g10453 [Zarea fungicola]|uniref:Uncharacterized protein n=1 Tax=Zarea fungicola TaxID=93591 RepID=A0ACC1MHQ0_9HYPO|nr:hypothetical protein NQ176_g10453 [Lecanicillium fungicola]